MDRGSRGSGRQHGMNPGEPPVVSLTDDQKVTVQAIFGKYDLSQLTADQAKAIFKSLEEAGIRGPAVRAAVEVAGLDPKKFWALGHVGQPHPPAGPQGGERRFPPPGSPGRRPVPRTASGKDAKKGGPKPS